MMIDRAVVEQALEALEVMNPYPASKADQRAGAITALRTVLAQEPTPPPEAVTEAEKTAYAAGWWAALAKGGGNPPAPLAVPPEVAATLTSTDIAWLQTHRLTRIWQELGRMRWVGADHGWDLAIKAVRRRLNDECQDVLNWKAQADQSGATAAELLQKVQGLRA